MPYPLSKCSTISCYLIMLHIKSSNLPNSIICSILNGNIVTKTKLYNTIFVRVTMIEPIKECIYSRYRTPCTKTYRFIVSLIRRIKINLNVCYSVSLNIKEEGNYSLPLLITFSQRTCDRHYQSQHQSSGWR